MRIPAPHHRVVLLLTATLVSLAACNRSEQNATASGTDHRRATASPSKSIRTTLLADPRTFNPLLVTDVPSSQAVGPIFDTLLRLDEIELRMVPHLAEAWESNADGTVYRFRLRRGVRWHDGEELTAADVAFTFRAIYDRRVPNSIRHILTVDGQAIEVEATDRYTVTMRLPRPFAPLLHTLVVEILPRHRLERYLEDGSFSRRWGIDTPPQEIIGTGPYRLVAYEPGQFLRYQRNPDYWMRDEAGERLPYLPQRTFLIVPNQDTAYLKFLAGETHVHQPRPEEIAELQDRAETLGIRVERLGLNTGQLFVTFNRNPQHYRDDRGRLDPRYRCFTDRRFLRALAHAVDKESIVQTCMHGFGRPAVSNISPENRLFHNPQLTDYHYDLDLARRLLDEAGYRVRDGETLRRDPDGNPISFTLYTNSGNRVRERICAILQQDWSRLGIDVDFRAIDFTLLVEKLDRTYDWDAVVIGFTGGIDPHNGANFLRSDGNLHLWHPNQKQPATEWEAEIDRLVDAGSRELEPQRRRQIYWRIQEILHQELPIIELARDEIYSAYRTSLRNFRPTVWGVYRPERVLLAE